MDATITTELGVFPSNWQVGRFDSIFDVQQGRQVSKNNRVGKNQQPFLRTKNVFWNRLELAVLDEMHFSEADESRLALKADDLLICEGGDIGRTAIWRGAISRCYYQNHLHRARIRNREAANAQFVLFWLWYAFEFGNLYFGRGNVTTIPNLSQSKLCELPLAIPPLAEQRKIAAVLGLVQRAMQQQERLIALTTELKKALLHQLFTQGLRDEPKKQTEIGPVPESWEVTSVGALIDITHGFAFASRYFTTSGSIVLTPGNFKLDGGLYWGERTKYTIEQSPDEFTFRAGDLVVVMTDLTPTAKLLGTPAFIPDSKVILHNQRIGKVVMRSEDTTRDFLYWVFLTDSFKRYMVLTATGSTVRHSSPTRIREFKFALPSRDEQREITKTLTTFDRKLANLEAKHAALTALFRTLLHQLMTAQLRVHDLDLSETTSPRPVAK